MTREEMTAFISQELRPLLARAQTAGGSVSMMSDESTDSMLRIEIRKPGTAAAPFTMFCDEVGNFVLHLGRHSVVEIVFDPTNRDDFQKAVHTAKDVASAVLGGGLLEEIWYLRDEPVRVRAVLRLKERSLVLRRCMRLFTMPFAHKAKETLRYTPYESA